MNGEHVEKHIMPSCGQLMNDDDDIASQILIITALTIKKLEILKNRLPFSYPKTQSHLQRCSRDRLQM